MANPMKVVKDSGKALGEAFKHTVPKERHYLDTLGVLYSLMRDLRTKSRNEIEAHIDNPAKSSIFQTAPTVLKNKELTAFICDYVRLIIIGNARSHEIEALMDEEINTITARQDEALQRHLDMGDAFPAIGIVAAVLGVIKAMGAHQRFAGSPRPRSARLSSAPSSASSCPIVCSPLVSQIKAVRTKQHRLYMIVKQTLLAYMNGSVPQVALEYGRKTISAYERPSIDAVEQEMMNPGRREQGGLIDHEKRFPSKTGNGPVLLAQLTGCLGEKATVEKLCASLSDVYSAFLPDIFKSETGLDVSVAYLGCRSGYKNDLIADLDTNVTLVDATLRNWSQNITFACGNSFVIALMESLLGAAPDTIEQPSRETALGHRARCCRHGLREDRQCLPFGRQRSGQFRVEYRAAARIGIPRQAFRGRTSTNSLRPSICRSRFRASPRNLR